MVLDNVTVGGRVIVFGKANVVVKNGSSINRIYGYANDGGFHINLTDDTKINLVSITYNSSITHGDVSIEYEDDCATVSGNFDTVVSDSNLELVRNGVTYCAFSDPGVFCVNLTKDCTVKELSLKYSVTIEGKGTVKHCSTLVIPMVPRLILQWRIS